MFLLTIIVFISEISGFTLLNRSNETVVIKSDSSMKHFYVPTSDEPLVTWMEVHKGHFPNFTSNPTNLTLGDPVTLIINFKDDSFLYDLKVTDCWAYDNKNISNSKYKMQLSRKPKYIGEWQKQIYSKGDNIRSKLFTNLTSFRFPDKEQVFITCDVQLCFKICDEKKNKVKT